MQWLDPPQPVKREEQLVDEALSCSVQWHVLFKGMAAWLAEVGSGQWQSDDGDVGANNELLQAAATQL